MSVYQLKSSFQKLLRPLVIKLAERGVTANQVTIAAALISVFLGILMMIWPYRLLFGLVPVWFFLRMALNAIDGMLAREHGQKSDLGGFLNELCDVVSDAALYIPFMWVSPFDAGWIFLIAFLSTLTEFAGVLGQAIRGLRTYDGPMGKSDRAVIFGALGFMIAAFSSLHPWFYWLQPILVALMIVTIIKRVRSALKR